MKRRDTNSSLLCFNDGYYPKWEVVPLVARGLWGFCMKPQLGWFANPRQAHWHIYVIKCIGSTFWRSSLSNDSCQNWKLCFMSTPAVSHAMVVRYIKTYWKDIGESHECAKKNGGCWKASLLKYSSVACPAVTLLEFAQLAFFPSFSFPSLPFSSLPHFKFLAKKEKNERIFTEVTVFEIRTFWTHTNSDSECCTSAPWELYGECLLDSFRPNTPPVLFHEPLFQGGDMICYGNFMVWCIVEYEIWQGRSTPSMRIKTLSNWSTAPRRRCDGIPELKYLGFS